MIVSPPTNVSVNVRVVVAALCVAAVVHLFFATARACDVTVNRYFLERWEREFYRAYYFNRGEEDKADREVNAFLEDTGSSFGSHVNLVFRDVDVDKLTDSAIANEDREIWNQHGTDTLPLHLILSPRGTLLFRGRLDLPTAKAVVHSPMRTCIARELCSGKDGLLLLLAGPDEKENEKAEKDIRWVLGKAKGEHGLDVAFLRLSQKTLQEKWLVRSLLGVVEEPPDDEECIVFGICGRGRILTGCIGEGITRRNIIECIGIMNGDCSCDLRFANPGMDLLTDWDWEGALVNLPPMTEEPLHSLLLGFDDSDEGAQESSRRELKAGRESGGPSLLRTRRVASWGLAVGIASIIVVGIGLLMIRKKRES